MSALVTSWADFEHKRTPLWRLQGLSKRWWRGCHISQAFLSGIPLCLAQRAFHAHPPARPCICYSPFGRFGCRLESPPFLFATSFGDHLILPLRNLLASRSIYPPCGPIRSASKRAPIPPFTRLEPIHSPAPPCSHPRRSSEHL